MNIEHEYVWTRMFAQSLEGEVKKWFRDLPPNSIRNIDDLDQVFLKQWGDKKYYYII